MLFPVLTRMGQVPRHSCLPLRSSRGWQEAELSWPPLRAGSQTLHSVITKGAGRPRPSRQPAGSSGRRIPGAGPANGAPSRRLLPRSRRGGDAGEGHQRLKAWARPRSGAIRTQPSSTSKPTCPLGPQLPHWPEAGWAGGPQGEALMCLLPRSPREDRCSTDRWLNRMLTVAHRPLVLGAGSTAALTNGRVGPRTATRWQLPAWGRGPLGLSQWLTATRWQLPAWGRHPLASANGWAGPLMVRGNGCLETRVLGKGAPVTDLC